MINPGTVAVLSLIIATPTQQQAPLDKNTAAYETLTKRERFEEGWEDATKALYGDELMDGWELRTNSHDGVAIRAAWSRVLRELSERTETRDMREQRRAMAEWFCGFIEGRLQVTVPVAWRQTIRDIRVNTHMDTFSSFPNTHFPLMGSEDTDLVGEDRAKWKIQGEHLVPTISDSATTFELPPESDVRFAVEVAEKMLLVVSTPRRYSNSYSVHRVGRNGRTTTVIKQRRLSAVSGFTGPPPPPGWVDAQLNANRDLVVFGAAIDVVFVEVVNPESGAIIASFSSAY